MTASGLSQADAAGPRGIESVAVVASLIVSLAGTAIAGYLVYENVQGESGVCVIAHGCSTVQNSSYGKILGIPVSVPGVLLYVALVGTAIAWLRDVPPGRPHLTAIAFYASLFGALFSGYLTYLEAFVIDAWCIYCVVSASLVTSLLLLWGGVLASTMRGAGGPGGAR